MQLTFTIEAEAITAEKQIFINKIKDLAQQDQDLVGDGTTHYGDLSGMTDDQIAALKIYDKRAGITYPEKTGTLTYAVVRKITDVDKWFFQKPDNAFMTDVVGSTEEEFDPEWLV